MNSTGFVNREVGQFPLSIGTSLALEGLIGIHPNQPKQPGGHRNMQALWINLRTLARNLYQAIKAEDIKKFTFVDAVAVLMQEVHSIPQILKDHNLSITPILYIEDMDSFRWVYPKAVIKRPKTEKQLHYQTYEEMVIAMLLQHLAEDKIEISVVKKQPTRQSTAIMLTHQPHQLLWQPAFERLMLLESHTGKLKLYNVWFTKLGGVDDENPMPFNRYTLQVFGDGSLFEAQPKDIKAELKQLAKFKRWTGITGRDKMVHDLLSTGSQALKKNYAELNP